MELIRSAGSKPMDSSSHAWSDPLSDRADKFSASDWSIGLGEYLQWRLPMEKQVEPPVAWAGGDPMGPVPQRSRKWSSLKLLFIHGAAAKLRGI